METVENDSEITTTAQPGRCRTHQCIAVAAFLLAIGVGGAGSTGAQTPVKPAPSKPPATAAVAPRVVATTNQLMHALTIPNSDVVFKLAGDPPTTDDGWTEV